MYAESDAIRTDNIIHKPIKKPFAINDIIANGNHTSTKILIQESFTELVG